VIPRGSAWHAACLHNPAPRASTIQAIQPSARRDAYHWIEVPMPLEPPVPRAGSGVRRSGLLRWVLVAASAAMLALVGCESRGSGPGCCASGKGNTDWCGPEHKSTVTTTTTTYPWPTTTTTPSGRPCEHSAGTGQAVCDQCLKGQCCTLLAACPEGDLLAGQCSELGTCAAAHCGTFCELSNGGAAGAAGAGGVAGDPGGAAGAGQGGFGGAGG
jgi:hypothetical protein